MYLDIFTGLHFLSINMFKKHNSIKNITIIAEINKSQGKFAIFTSKQRNEYKISALIFL